MSTAELQQPILDGGIRSINFFNGRLLTARDLTREQVANRDVDKRLGQAIGDGVAYGFEVSKSTLPESTTASPILTIAAGLAINRRGQTLKLDNNVDVGLVRQPNSDSSNERPFNECVPLQTGTFTAGAGVYVLTVAPAETTEGLAATAGLETAIASCNTDTIVSALQFRLVQLNPPLTDAELDDENYLRNVIAYKCFGIDDLRSLDADPFGTRLSQYGLLDSLRPNRLTDCDVPLAILYWTLAGGIRFIDMWSVRRRLTQRKDAGPYAVMHHDRRAAEGEAMFLQFQQHIDDLRKAEANTSTLIAKSRFRFLPPIGILPLQQGAATGFSVSAFLHGIAHRQPEFIDGARLNALISEAIEFNPVRLVDLIDPDDCEMVWLYSPWQNERSATENGSQRYVIFTSAHVHYAATPRFDVTRWNYGNYPSCGSPSLVKARKEASYIGRR